MGSEKGYVIGDLTIDGSIALLYTGGEKEFLIMELDPIIESVQMKRDELKLEHGDWLIRIEYRPRYGQ